MRPAVGTRAPNPGRRAPRLARLALLLAALPLLMGAECEEPLVRDSGFDLWCGDTLCGWQLDEGTIAKVATWHARDFGVALLGDATRISQRLTFGSDDVSCLHFDLLADVAEPVNVTLELDFDDDGHPEQTETIPSGAWIPLSYHISAPTYYRALRISLRKSGAGHAALAQIQAAKSSDCAGPPLATLNRPLGATCEEAAACVTGLCLPPAPGESLLANQPPPPASDPVRLVCEGCGGDTDCPTGNVCGLGFRDGFAPPFRSCTPAAGRLLGERCLAGAECGGGVCCRGICAICCPGAGPGCDDAGDTGGGPDAPCLADNDCASGQCAGDTPLMVCATDGRRCVADADCPASIGDNRCIARGVAGGRCL